MDIAKQLLAYESRLHKARKIKPFSSEKWVSEIPKESGVYVLWEGSIPKYVGETSSLQLRMKDLSRPINHSFTKKFAKTKKIPANDTKKIAKAISSKFMLSFMEVQFGRAEIEEFLILRWRTTLINKPAKRLLHSPQYEWVKPVFENNEKSV